MKTLRYLYALCLVACCMGFTACNDDDDNGGSSDPVVVSKVYLQDVESSVPDREVTFARLGQLVRVEGQNFLGLRKILVNGYETYFNNALMTDNNVWFTLNSKTPIYDADPEVRNTIQFVKDNNTTVYEFDIRSASPSITSIDNTLPMPGEKVYVNGSNLHETSSVTLPSGTVITSGIESDEDGEWFSFVMPSGETASGKYPLEAVETMAAIAEQAEHDRNAIAAMEVPMGNDCSQREFLAHAAIDSTRKIGVAGIITASETGETARHLAAFRGPTPILAICYREKTQRWLNLSYGVTPIYQREHTSPEHTFIAALRMLRQKGYIDIDDKIAYLGGSLGDNGGTTYLEINRVRQVFDKSYEFHLPQLRMKD